MKVLITGGSGLIGLRLTSLLLEKGIEVVHLTRSKNSRSGVKTYEWDWESGSIDKNCFTGVTHIVHLAGAGIADKPWTMKRKRHIIKSRVETARLLYKAISTENIPIKAFISASGIGYYGAETSKHIYVETDSPTDHFISKCCQFWEDAADSFLGSSRVVKLRIGMVLDKDKGGLQKIASSVKSGFGAPLGKGNQYVPWIHIDDIARLFIYALENDSIEGVYNAVAPDHIDNKKLTYSVGTALHKKLRMPNIPAFIIRTIYGELSDIILKGSRVSSQKIIDAGFLIEYDNIDKATLSIFSKKQ